MGNFRLPNLARKGLMVDGSLVMDVDINISRISGNTGGLGLRSALSYFIRLRGILHLRGLGAKRGSTGILKPPLLNDILLQRLTSSTSLRLSVSSCCVGEFGLPCLANPSRNPNSRSLSCKKCVGFCSQGCCCVQVFARLSRRCSTCPGRANMPCLPSALALLTSPLTIIVRW